MNLPEKAKQVLMHLGLSEYMVTEKDSPLYHNVNQLYDESVFELYTPRVTNNNQSAEETDMFDGSLIYGFLHLPSGIRCEYCIHEFSLTKDVYELSRFIVLTDDDETLDVLGADFDEGTILTSRGTIPFKKMIRSTDRSRIPDQQSIGSRH